MTTTKKNDRPADPAAKLADPTPGRLPNPAAARRKAERVRAMSPEDQRRFIAEYEEMLDASAPNNEAAGSDLLVLLQAVGREFVRRYSPGADHATSIVNIPEAAGGPHLHASLPVPVPGDG